MKIKKYSNGEHEIEVVKLTRKNYLKVIEWGKLKKYSVKKFGIYGYGRWFDNAFWGDFLYKYCNSDNDYIHRIRKIDLKESYYKSNKKKQIAKLITVGDN